MLSAAPVQEHPGGWRGAPKEAPATDLGSPARGRYRAHGPVGSPAGGAVRIKVVGPCASGKSALVARLRAFGYEASSAAQDHSYVPDMWQRLSPPDVLIYLDVGLETARQRGRSSFGWDQAYLDEQHQRLRHAREHCDLYLPTDGLSEEQVLARVVAFLHGLFDGLS